MMAAPSCACRRCSTCAVAEFAYYWIQTSSQNTNTLGTADVTRAVAQSRRGWVEPVPDRKRGKIKPKRCVKCAAIAPDEKRCPRCGCTRLA